MHVRETDLLQPAGKTIGIAIYQRKSVISARESLWSNVSLLPAFNYEVNNVLPIGNPEHPLNVSSRALASTIVYADRLYCLEPQSVQTPKAILLMPFNST